MIGPRKWMAIAVKPQQVDRLPNVRNVRISDADALGALLIDAYKGTVDDEGESPAEAVEVAKKALGGAHGEPIWEASFAVLNEERMVGVSFVTIFDGAPLLAFCATAKGSQNKGIGTNLTRSSIDALSALGYRNLRLVVTRANRPAVSLYERLGFEDERHGGA